MNTAEYLYTLENTINVASNITSLVLRSSFSYMVLCMSKYGSKVLKNFPAIVYALVHKQRTALSKASRKKLNTASRTPKQIASAFWEPALFSKHNSGARAF